MDLLRRSVNAVTLDKKAIISNLARIVESVLASGEDSGEQELRRLELELEKLQARNDTIHDRFFDENITKADYQRAKARCESEMNRVQEIDLCFLFAQAYHASMRFAGPARKELGIRTVFNIIGPLANPAFASLQLLGVYKKELVEPLAKVLANLGVKRGIVVYGNDGIDEVTVSSTNTIAEINDGEITTYTLDPQAFGFIPCKKSDLMGGDAKINAGITYDILSGKEQGAKRDAVVLNSGLSLYLGGKGSIKECIELARITLDNGKALQKLQQLIVLSNG